MRNVTSQKTQQFMKLKSRLGGGGVQKLTLSFLSREDAGPGLAGKESISELSGPWSCRSKTC